MALREILENSGILRAEKETPAQRKMRIFNRYISPAVGLFLLFSNRACIYDRIMDLEGDSENPRIGDSPVAGAKSHSKETKINIGGKGAGDEVTALQPLDPIQHMEEAKKIRYEVYAKSGSAPTNQGEPRKNITPTLEYTITKESGDLTYERQTSLIQPRPASSIDQTIRDAMVFLDVSGSMNVKVNLQNINVPAVAAIAISQYYINERGASVAGAIFNGKTAYTTYTTDLNALAKLFAKFPDGGTLLDVGILQNLSADPNRPHPNAPVDIYIISDLAFSNIDAVIYNLRQNAKLGIVYVLEVSSGNPNAATRIFGPDAYRTQLNDYGDLKTFYRNFRQARPNNHN